MELTWAIAKLTEGAEGIRALSAEVADERARWKPDAESWSVLEVLCHLLDEERFDFRLRLAHILSGAEGSWPPIDPGGWVTERRYNEQDPGGTLAAFLSERRTSLLWLQSLLVKEKEIDWEATYAAPWGEIRAGDMLGAWLAHDLLHTRQLVELHWAYTVQQAAPYDVRYAGAW